MPEAEYNVHRVVLPSTVRASMASGQATVGPTLMGPYLSGDPGTISPEAGGNGAGLDSAGFDPNPTAVPEPSRLAPCGVTSLAGMGAWARRRRAATA